MVSSTWISRLSWAAAVALCISSRSVSIVFTYKSCICASFSQSNTDIVTLPSDQSFILSYISELFSYFTYIFANFSKLFAHITWLFAHVSFLLANIT